MHTPSMLTPLLANDVIAEHAAAARARRASRRSGNRFARLRPRRPGASHGLAPDGRPATAR